MSNDNLGVQFEEDDADYSYISEKRTSWLITLVLKISKGAIKDEKQARGFLLSVALVMFALSFLIFIKDRNDQEYSAGKNPIIPAEIRYTR